MSDGDHVKGRAADIEPGPQRTISHEDFLRLEGLLTLAHDHNRELRILDRCACALTGDRDLTGDAVYDTFATDQRAKDLCGRLGLTVEAPPEEAAA